MDRAKSIRLFIEQVKSIKNLEDELWEFVRIPKERTNLKYDIFVDDNAAYKSYKHQLWLYVDCGSLKVPITIEPQPTVMMFIKNNQYDFSDVYDFISTNHTILEKFANIEIDYKIFYHLIKNVCETKTYLKQNEEKQKKTL